MLSSIHIQGFKGFKDTKIEPLRRVNLIVGGQNSGKTSVLEAIHYVHASDDVNNFFGERRNLPTAFRVGELNDATRFWNEMYGSIENPKKLLIETKLADITTYQLGGTHQFDGALGRLAFQSLKNAPLGVFFNGSRPNSEYQSLPISTFPTLQSKLVELYGKLVHSKNKKKLIQLLHEVEPRLDGIDAIAPDGEHRVYVDLDCEGVFPMPMLGQGFSRLFDIYSKLLVSGSKLALIDELENGIHYSVLPTVWQGIANIARELDIQLFITTHSYECIQAAAKVFEATPEEFQVIRLERTEDNVDAKCIPGDRVASVLERGWEIR
jgi:AAA15 family ATPase/GTPase